MVRALLLSIMLIYPGALWAGAWPRAKGETFLSYSVEIDQTNPGDSPGSLFVERGLKRKVTIGFDGGGRQTDLTKAIAFLRWPVPTHAKEAVTAFEMGAGFANDRLALRPGLSWGRGLSLGERSGWVAVDMRGLVYDHAEGLLEADFTFGLKPGRHSIAIMQIQTGVPSDAEPYARIAPSFVYECRATRSMQSRDILRAVRRCSNAGAAFCGYTLSCT